MKTHYKKTIEPYFTDVEKGDKTFELRYNDCDFQPNDELVLKQFIDGQLTGKEITKTIATMLDHIEEEGLEEGYVILDIDKDAPFVICEYDPERKIKVGDAVRDYFEGVVSYVLRDVPQYGLKPGYCIYSRKIQ